MTGFDRLRIAVMRANDESRVSHTAVHIARKAREYSGLTIDEIDLTSLSATVTASAQQSDSVPCEVVSLFPRVNTADGFIVVISSQEVPVLRAAWSWFADAWTHRPVGLVLGAQDTADHGPLERLWQCIPGGHTVPPLIIPRRSPRGDPRMPGAPQANDTDDFLDRLCWWARVLRDARRRYPRHH